MAWDPTEDPVVIVQDWSSLTFDLNPSITDIVTQISMDSWPAYLNYSTRNFGLSSLTESAIHFGSKISKKSLLYIKVQEKLIQV